MKIQLFVGSGSDKIVLTAEGMIERGVLDKFHDGDCEYAIVRDAEGNTMIALRRKRGDGEGTQLPN